MKKCCDEELYEAVRDLIVFVIDSENIVNIDEIKKESIKIVNEEFTKFEESIEIKLQNIEKRIDNEIVVLNEKMDSLDSRIELLELKGGENNGEEQNS